MQLELPSAQAVMKNRRRSRNWRARVHDHRRPGVPRAVTEARVRLGTHFAALQVFEIEISDEGTPAHQVELLAITRLIGTWYCEVASFDIDWRTDHPERVVALEKSGRGKMLIDDLRAEVDRFDRAERTQVADLNARAAAKTLFTPAATARKSAAPHGHVDASRDADTRCGVDIPVAAEDLNRQRRLPGARTRSSRRCRWRCCGPRRSGPWWPCRARLRVGDFRRVAVVTTQPMLLLSAEQVSYSGRRRPANSGWVRSMLVSRSALLAETGWRPSASSAVQEARVFVRLR
jgi:hypothetical protein